MTRPAPHGHLLLIVLLAAVTGPAPVSPQTTPTASRLEKLGWLAGSWALDSAGTRSEEHWTAPRGGLMVGMNRLVIGGRARAFEFLRIREQGDTIAYLASPGGRAATAFPLKELGERRVVFENLAHDFPQRVIYWLADDGRLRARVEGMMKGRLASEEYLWRKDALAP